MWPKGPGKRWEGDDLALLMADVYTNNRNNEYSLSIYNRLFWNRSSNFKDRVEGTRSFNHLPLDKSLPSSL